jgi:prepilin-type N-terminal cleavage/methylation domain-containing protein
MNRPSRISRRSRRAGFTLLELMVALTVGTIVIVAVFSLGGASARHFQEQQRVGATQRTLRMGIDRLRRDIARAGFMGLADTQGPTTQMCPTPALPRRVSAVRFQNDDPEGMAALAAINGPANRVSADRLRLVGNFETGESYLVRSFDSTGGQVFLQTNWLGFRRSFVNTDGLAATVDTERFTQVFAPGRMLHIETPNRMHFVVRITGVSVTESGNVAAVNIAPAVGIDNPCLRGLGRGSTVAPLSEIEYFVGTPAAGSPLAPRAPEVTGANTILYRQELDMATGTPIPGSRRAVVEYTVDFNLDFILDTNLNPTLPPTIVRRTGDDAQTVVTTNPFQVRGIVASVAARTPEQDSRFGWPTTWASGRPADEPLNRYQVFPARRGAARVRQMITEVQIPNLLPQ